MISEHKLNLSLKDIPQFTKNIIGELKPLGVNKDVLFDLRLVVEEALANAIKHGNKTDPSKSVFLKINASNERIDIEIKDRGRGFDYKKLPLPTDKKNIHRHSGRGIFLIKKLMDKVKFFDGGSKIKITKLLKNKPARRLPERFAARLDSVVDPRRTRRVGRQSRQGA